MKTVTRLFALFAAALAPLLSGPGGTPAYAGPAPDITVQLAEVGGSGVGGTVELTQLAEGTRVSVVANGLTPFHRYVSLVYENETCKIEPYSIHDVIGGAKGPYLANRQGVGKVSADVSEDLDEILSVSVRSATTGKLLACAVVHQT